MNAWEKSEDSVGYVQAAWRSSDSTGLSLGKWRDTVHTVCTLSNKWWGGGATPQAQPLQCIHTPLSWSLKTRSARLVVFISESARLCVWETNSQSFLHNTPPPKKKEKKPFSNGAPLYWTVKRLPLSARTYIYSSGSVYVLLHARGHIQRVHICILRGSPQHFSQH